MASRPLSIDHLIGGAIASSAIGSGLISPSIAACG
jgi:hypothetical protein